MLHTHIKSNRFSARAMTFSAGLLLVLSISTVFPFTNNTNDVEAATPVASETTLTLSTSDLSLVFDIDSFEGTFAASDPAVISVSTNNYTGYTLNFSATSSGANATKLMNGDDAINSISSASTPEEFNVNNWGYLPSKFNSSDNTLYRPAPDANGATLDHTNAANLENNEYTVVLGAKADYSTPVGTYQNTFNFTAVANATAFTINYNKNTTDEVSNLPSAQSSDTTSNYARISSNIPTRAGYTFLEWNTAADGTGTSHQPNHYIALDQTTSNVTTLYARWVITFDNAFAGADKETVTVSGKQYYKLQDMDPSLCAAVDAGQIGQLVDIRDNHIYNVEKLADNRCWTLDNLSLNLADDDVKNNLTAATTNASSATLDYLKNGGGSASDKYAISGVISTWRDGESSYSAPRYYDGYADEYYVDYVTDDYVIFDANEDIKFGNYYNFCAASAGSYCYGNGTSTGTSSGSATEDICPAGWRMPTGDDSGEMQNLITAITGTTGTINDQTKGDEFRSAFWALLGARFAGSGFTSEFGNGSIWTNARVDNKNMYNTFYAKSGVIPAATNSGDRIYGLFVRCVAYNGPKINISFNANGGSGTMADQNLGEFGGTLNSNTFTRPGYTFTGWNTAANGSGTSYANGATYTGTSTTLYAQWQKLYIQNVTTATCPTTASVAYDSRDETAYTIQKLADGKCWMLDNLALDISNSTIKSKLSAANTNASATTLNYLKNGGGSTSNKYPVSGATNWTADMSYSVPLVSVANKNTIPNNSNYGPGNHKVGGYYNFCAASAGSYCYGNGEMDYGNPSGNATEDICPAGWRMPTGGASGEYKALATAITGATSYNITDAAHVAAFRNALSLPFNGDWYGNSPSNQGTNGYFWASTMEDEESMHYLWVSQSYGVSPSASSMRTGGYAVRCLAK